VVLYLHSPSYRAQGQLYASNLNLIRHFAPTGCEKSTFNMDLGNVDSAVEGTELECD